MNILNMNKEPPKIRVVVRKRPLTSKEQKRADTDVLDILDEQSLIVKELK
jgi:kinesin family protein 2/24